MSRTAALEIVVWIDFQLFAYCRVFMSDLLFRGAVLSLSKRIFGGPGGSITWPRVSCPKNAFARGKKSAVYTERTWMRNWSLHFLE